jgi:ABC-type spermidine/putrescine transport system permease subunit II
MSRAGTALYRMTVGATVVFLLAPAVVVVLMSFSDATHLSFPPAEWGLRQYESLSRSDVWGEATGRSLLIAFPVALLAVAAATLLVIGLQRTRLPFKEAVVALCTVPILVPGVALAVALYEFLARGGLLDSYLGVILAHTVYTLPVAVLVMWPAIRAIPPDLELVAMTLGAGRARAWFGVTLRLLAPALLASGIIAFVTSFDEATLVSFISGPRTTTLPKAILDSVATGVDPTITAIAALLIAATAVLLGVAEVLRTRSTNR